MSAYPPRSRFAVRTVAGYGQAFAEWQPSVGGSGFLTLSTPDGCACLWISQPDVREFIHVLLASQSPVQPRLETVAGGGVVLPLAGTLASQEAAQEVVTILPGEGLVCERCGEVTHDGELCPECAAEAADYARECDLDERRSWGER